MRRKFTKRERALRGVPWCEACVERKVIFTPFYSSLLPLLAGLSPMTCPTLPQGLETLFHILCAKNSNIRISGSFPRLEMSYSQISYLYHLKGKLHCCYKATPKGGQPT